MDEYERLITAAVNLCRSGPWYSYGLEEEEIEELWEELKQALRALGEEV
jgi:hypothetical protein